MERLQVRGDVCKERVGGTNRIAAIVLAQSPIRMPTLAVRPY